MWSALSSIDVADMILVMTMIVHRHHLALVWGKRRRFSWLLHLVCPWFIATISWCARCIVEGNCHLNNVADNGRCRWPSYINRCIRQRREIIEVLLSYLTHLHPLQLLSIMICWQLQQLMTSVSDVKPIRQCFMCRLFLLLQINLIYLSLYHQTVFVEYRWC